MPELGPVALCAATGGQALRFIIGLPFVMRDQDAGVLLPALANPSPALDPVGEDTEHSVALSDTERTIGNGDHGSGAILPFDVYLSVLDSQSLSQSIMTRYSA